MTGSRSLLATLLALVASAALAACGGSSSATSSGASASTSSSSPSPTPTGAASSSSSSNSGSVVPVGAPPCRAAGLSLSFLGGQGATGHGLLGFALRNTTSHRCHTIGYPGVLFLNRAGRGLPTIPTHATHDFFGVAPIASLTVAPGARVSFRLGVTHGITSSAGCTTAYGVQVIPPNDTATLRIRIPNGGAYECRTVSVSPIRPGLSAYP